MTFTSVTITTATIIVVSTYRFISFASLFVITIVVTIRIKQKLQGHASTTTAANSAWFDDATTITAASVDASSATTTSCFTLSSDYSLSFANELLTFTIAIDDEQQ